MSDISLAPARRSLWPRLRLVLFLAVVVLAAWWARRAGVVDLVQDQAHLRALVVQYGAMAPLAFSGMRVAALLVNVPSAVLAMATGFLFEPWLALLINLVTTPAAALIAFYVARGAGREAMQGLLPKGLAKFDAYVAADGFRMMVFMRVNPAFPFSPVSYWAGLSQMQARDYLLGTTLGMLPHLAIYTYLGAVMADISPLRVGIAIGILVLLSLFSLRLQKPRQD